MLLSRSGTFLEPSSHVVEVVEADEPVRAAYRQVVGQRHEAGHAAHSDRDDGKRRRGLPRHLTTSPGWAWAANKNEKQEGGGGGVHIFLLVHVPKKEHRK